MSAEIQVVEEFIAAINAQDVEAVMAFFTPDAVYHNMPMPPAQGTDAIRNVIAMFVTPADRIEWRILAIAQTGHTVLTERDDRFEMGGRAVALPVMGAFEVEAGRIVAWRDYFDMATWQGQLGA